MRYLHVVLLKYLVQEQRQHEPHGKRWPVKVQRRAAPQQVTHAVEEKDTQNIRPQERLKGDGSALFRLLGKVARQEHERLHDKYVDGYVDDAAEGIVAEVPRPFS